VLPSTPPPSPSTWQWHRPYVRLFEMHLCRVATSDVVRAHFTGHADEDKYTAAAQALRLPYIVWEDADPILFCGRDTVEVVDMGSPGNKRTIANPLLGYTFPRPVEGTVHTGGPRDTTVRWSRARNPRQMFLDVTRAVSPSYARDVQRCDTLSRYHVSTHHFLSRGALVGVCKHVYITIPS
jgi:hypothetical protein